MIPLKGDIFSLRLLYLITCKQTGRKSGELELIGDLETENLEKQGKNENSSHIIEKKPKNCKKNSLNCEKQGIIEVLRARNFGWAAMKMEDCHTRFNFFSCRGCGAVGIFPNSCNNRICPDCGVKIKNRLITKYENSFGGLSKFYRYRLKMLTVTLVNVEALNGSVNVFSEIRKAFLRFRHRAVLAKKLYGGVYAIEVTNQGKGWNVHLHALVSMEYHQDGCSGMKECRDRESEERFEGVYCSVCRGKCLRRLWQEASGSTVVDVRRVHNPRKAVIEIIGYITKPVPLADPERLVEWWEAMRSKPFVKTFGCFRGLGTERLKLVCPFCEGTEFRVFGDGFYTLVDLREDQERSPPVEPGDLVHPVFVSPAYVLDREDERGFVHTSVYLVDGGYIRGAVYR